MRSASTMASETASGHLAIGTPFTLPNGVTVKNRLVKAAMAEPYFTKDSLPHDQYNTNYATWAHGGWGMVITGNWYVDSKGCGGPGGVLLDNPSVPREVQVAKIAAFARAAAGVDGQTKVLVQLCHAGRQGIVGSGTRGLCEPGMAPSAVPQSVGSDIISRGLARLFFGGAPREMTHADIDAVVDKFASAAKLVADAGCHGVELHGAHGYLISQFLSAEANRRTDEYGGSALARARFAVRVVQAVRAVVPADFVVGIKLNSVDYQTDIIRKGGDGAEDEVEDAAKVDRERQLQGCIEQFAAIAAAGVDFVEVSGGSMADPQMSVGPPKSERTKAREAFFLSFAETFRASFPDVPLMVTGGFRSRSGMEEAVAGGGTDLVGIGRAAVVSPALPRDVVLNPDVPDPEARVDVPKYLPPWYLNWGPRLVGLGYENVIYGSMITKLGVESGGK
ncbi:hypothetical protein Micbo1qcDRAFT_216093 [Microdochium bolleyi]|uniref:NADH:flavin oxidoreductase/NADH oxidase N-terminal domain-containing protein n=1 Tax=Microdochium bolleyi TaxID=196109 RepID=A0A136IRV4_9PEZI|nr:hypothetical protein Micbo1qcDRAFT_216093 [Microdochium bolleyi]